MRSWVGDPRSGQIGLFSRLDKEVRTISRLRERAEAMRKRKAEAEAEETPASADEADDEVVEEDDDDFEDDTDFEADDDFEDEDEGDDAEVIDLAEKAIERLSDEQVADIMAQAAEAEATPGLAPLNPTRTTKANQVQYDGVTAEGYIVRVWAPRELPAISGAQLDKAS